jgi:hypothetical protein
MYYHPSEICRRIDHTVVHFSLIGVVITHALSFQYFSSLPVLHYLQAVLFFIKIEKKFMNILYNTL